MVVPSLVSAGKVVSFSFKVNVPFLRLLVSLIEVVCTCGVESLGDGWPNVWRKTEKLPWEHPSAPTRNSVLHCISTWPSGFYSAPLAQTWNRRQSNEILRESMKKKYRGGEETNKPHCASDCHIFAPSGWNLKNLYTVYNESASLLVKLFGREKVKLKLGNLLHFGSHMREDVMVFNVWYNKKII